jgi:hypothetical protein
LLALPVLLQSALDNVAYRIHRIFAVWRPKPEPLAIMDMGDMHMNDEGLGMDFNYAFARDYWYILAAVVGGLTAIRGIELYTARQRYSALRANVACLITC